MPKLFENFPVFDFDKLWDGYSDTYCELVPLSQREVSILMSCLRLAHWSTRWYGGNLRLEYQDRLADLETAYTYVASLERKLLMSGCLEGLIDAVEGIGAKLDDLINIQAYCCGQGAGSQGAGGTEEPASEEDMTPGSMPPGFETSGEFDVYKCRMAQQIIDEWVTTVDNLGALAWAGLVITTALPVVGALLATPIPGDEIIAIIGFSLLLASTGVATSSYDAVSSAIGNNANDLLCTLYNASSVDTLKAALTSQVGDYIEAETTDPVVEFGAKGVFDYLISNDNLNRLVEPIPDWEQENMPSADCSSCEAEGCGPVEYEGIPGTFQRTNLGGGDWQIDIIAGGPHGSVPYVAPFARPSGDCCYTVTDWEVISGSWSPYQTDNFGYKYNCQSQVVNFDDDQNLILGDNATTVCYSTTPFTIRILLSEQ